MEQSLALAADAWGASRAWWLTNGSSQGNLVSALAVAGLGKSIVVQRSVHSSVIDGLAISGLDATFVQPSFVPDLGVANGVSVEDLRAALMATPDAAAAYIVSPSYFGAVSDIAALANVAHEFNVALIVDEAWGAHFGFHERFPTNAIRLGADLVVTSVHKLGGSLSQTGVLQLGHSPFAKALEPLVDRAFRSMQSTSVLSWLYVSLDIARRDLVLGKSLPRSLECAAQIRSEIATSNRFSDIGPTLQGYPDVKFLDPLRISIDTASGGISGYEAKANLLANSGIQVEMATGRTIVMLIGAGSAPDVQRIIAALDALPTSLQAVSDELRLPLPGERARTVREAYFATTEVVAIENCVGRISADSLAAYPPGIPNLLPGEIITGETIDFLRATKAAPGGHVRGGATTDLSGLRVII
jgi:lysine decarboxylase